LPSDGIRRRGGLGNVAKTIVKPYFKRVFFNKQLFADKTGSFYAAFLYVLEKYGVGLEGTFRGFAYEKRIIAKSRSNFTRLEF
jgi:hypothetical protein